jgi:hypothetical protein
LIYSCIRSISPRFDRTFLDLCKRSDWHHSLDFWLDLRQTSSTILDLLNLLIRVIHSISSTTFSEPFPNQFQPIPTFGDVSRFSNSPDSFVPRFARPYPATTADSRPQCVESELCLESLTLYL